jgi:serine/threonine protein kinase
MSETNSLNTPNSPTGPSLLPDPEATKTPDASGHVFFERIGVGGMGEVYRCGDDALQRDLAIKVLRAELLGNADAEERFLREARLTGSLQHPGIVPVHNLGKLADGRPCYTMKLVRGRTLAKLLRDEPDGPERLPRLVAVIEKVCQAVAFAHSKDIIHRDLKPSNVMVGEFGEVQVMDWGLAKQLSRAEPETPPGEATEDVETVARAEEAEGLSRAGAALGTPAYMPPEQAAGDWGIVDERADVFALGAILCEVLTGCPPYHGGNREYRLRRARRGDVAEALGRLERCGADGALTALCRECLTAEREGRPRDASVLARRLADYEAELQERLRWAEWERAQERVRRTESERKRRVLPLILLIPSLIVFIRNLADTNLPPLLSRFALIFQGGVTLALALMVCVLWLRKPLSLPVLRIIELAIFGSMAIFFGWLQYRDFNHGPLAESSTSAAGPLILRQAVGNSSTKWFFLIVLYGAFIPNTWRRCLLMSLGLALTPLILTPLAASRDGPLEPEMRFALIDLATLLSVAIAIAVSCSYRIETIPRPAASRSGSAATPAGPVSNPSGSRPPAELIAQPWYRDRILLFGIGSAVFVLGLAALYYFLHG